MRRALIVVIVALIAIGLLFSVALFAHIPLGEPKLRIEFYPSPPWQVRTGDTFEVAIGVANDGWLLAWAKNVRVLVLMPEGFTESYTGTNQREMYFGTLHGGDGMGNTLSVLVSGNASSGTYTITLKVFGENVPEKVLTPQVEVLPL